MERSFEGDIAVVIPCFNRERQLPLAIESALRQDLPPAEIIVVDDGSDDRSAEVASGYGQPVTLVRSANRGPSAARNLALATATAPWVAFLDSDDVWHTEKLSRQVAALRTFPRSALVFCDTLAIERDRVRIPSRFALGGIYGVEADRQGQHLLFDRSLFLSMTQQSRIFTSTVLVRRNLPELRFPEELCRAEDWALWLRLVLRYPIAAVDRVLVTMHYDGDNLTTSRREVLLSGVRVLEDLQRREELSREERSAVAAALARRRQSALYQCIVDGDTLEARRLLKQVSPAGFGRGRWLSYRLLSHLPASLLRALVRRRSGRRPVPGSLDHDAAQLSSPGS